METVKVFSPFHFEHRVYDECFCEVGELVYNVANTIRPITKRGKAPHELLTFYSHWYTMEDVVETLVLLGFEKINELEWRLL